MRIEYRIGQWIEFPFAVIALIHLDSEFVEPVPVKMTAMTKRAFFNGQTIYHLNFIDRLYWMLGIVPGIRRIDDHRI